jgi:hypothetical protein
MSKADMYRKAVLHVSGFPHSAGKSSWTPLELPKFKIAKKSKFAQFVKMANPAYQPSGDLPSN